MFKYIVKRILISIVILFGVSVIIYTLVRLMPTDYIDVKYSSQLQQGSMTQQDIDDFKKLYGLYSPEAEITITFDGVSYSRDVKKNAHDTSVEADNVYTDFLIGDYKNGNDRLELLKDDGNAYVFNVVKAEFKESVQKDENGKDKVTHVKIEKVVYSGTFSGKSDAESVIFNVNGTETETKTGYKVFSFWERLGTILQGYFTWVGNMIKGDLGTSFKYEKPVAQVIGENMWISFAIALVATILQFLIAIPLGISSATHQYSARDYLVTIFTMIGLSLPTYFFAAIMVKVFAVDLGWLPTSGLVDAGTYPATFAGTMAKVGSMAKHLVLPIFVSVILSLGGLMRYTRTNTLEVLNADYIRTARAKGLSEKTVIYKHAFRNTLIPLATLLAGILPSLFGGMMITEQVFAIDGIGNLAYKALKDGDIPFIMGYNMFLAILTVIGTLLSDIMYSIVDPRVKLGK